MPATRRGWPGFGSRSRSDSSLGTPRNGTQLTVWSRGASEKAWSDPAYFSILDSKPDDLSRCLNPPRSEAADARHLASWRAERSAVQDRTFCSTSTSTERSAPENMLENTRRSAIRLNQVIH
ncbi:hypothetical protein VTN96DRAFT_7901 [Rasamsonia emersonii]